jgi:hypothetical protein
MIVDMCLAGVLVLNVLMGHVRMPHRRVVVLVLVSRAEVLEATGHIIVVVRDMVVPVGMHQPLVVVLFPPSRGRVLRHRCSLALA